MLNIVKQFAHQLISPEGAGRAKYTIFKELLKQDRHAHDMLAELEELYYQHKKVDINVVNRLFNELSTAVSTMVSCLSHLAPGSYGNLRDYYKKFDFYARFALSPPEIDTSPPFILPINGFYDNDLQVGGKGFHLAQVKEILGLPVPEGFVISTSAYNFFIEKNGLKHRVYDLLSRLDSNSPSLYKEISEKLTSLILNADVPTNLEKTIIFSFEELRKGSGTELFALRSSAVSEDSHISFAGQYSSILQVDKSILIASYKKVLAGKFSPRALYYRIMNGILDDATPMAVLVLEMIDAEASGVITTINPTDRNNDDIFIHTVRGLGESLVGGKISPETIIVKKKDDGVIFKRQSPARGRNSTQHTSFTLSDKDALQLAAWARQIESFYNTPQDIEWSLDRHNRLFLLQARSLHVQEKSEKTDIPKTEGIPVLLQGGEAASRGVACGRIYHLDNENNMHMIPEGAILVTPVTPPSYVRILDRLAGVVADQGSAADHFASVAREFGVPVLVKTGNACLKLQEGSTVTLWPDEKKVLDGHIDSLLQHYKPVKSPHAQSPFQRAFKMVIDFISPLQLVNPDDPAFIPESCRSLHDIIRFAHEKGVQAMFSQAREGFIRKAGAKRLKSVVPLNFFVLDVGGGIKKNTTEKEIGLDDLRSIPLLALWKGLTHKGVKWSEHDHFDWKSFDDVTLAGGVAGKDDSAFASYAVVSRDYLNLNIRFGYHFALLDSLCGSIPEENYILMRFAGGGGDSSGKSLRLDFIAEILSRLGFSTKQKGDLLDARLMRYDEQTTSDKLDMLGRLLGATKLMDMILLDSHMVEKAVDEFMNGRYDFSKT